MNARKLLNSPNRLFISIKNDDNSSLLSPRFSIAIHSGFFMARIDSSKMSRNEEILIVFSKPFVVASLSLPFIADRRIQSREIMLKVKKKFPRQANKVIM
jgi:hypothetical protein